MVTVNACELPESPATLAPTKHQQRQVYPEAAGDDDLDETERQYARLTDDEETEDEEDLQGDALAVKGGDKDRYRGKRQWTEARKIRNAAFLKWFTKMKNDGVVRDLDLSKDDEKLSTKALIASTTTAIIGQPRDYQLQLFEVAKQQNTLAVLDTGSGKTLIACLLIRYMLDQELEARKRGERRRVSFFLVDSVTLVFQQHAVISCNIDGTVGKYCGDMCTDLWNIKAWQKILDKDQVIVMTADVLHNCLTHAFITMKDINLLCFDEAHHAKKNHVYARIIKDFYLCEPEKVRPKVFGMTASPVDARVKDVVAAAKELEVLLNSRIITTSDLSLLQNHVSRPKELIAQYDPLPKPFKTTLYKELWEIYGGNGPLKRVFTFAYQASAELGEWCAEYVWAFALSDLEAKKLERKAEKELNMRLTEEKAKKIEKDIEIIREARQFVEDYPFRAPDMKSNMFSPKVIMLYNAVNRIFSVQTEKKCIIFVTQRYTACVLYELLKRLAPKYLKLGILIGRQGDLHGDTKFSLRQQMLNVSRFRRGMLNCLIATSVAEEGLDIPDCNTVIRFDLYTTMIQYVQSRGRARHSDSVYIHMIEKDNRMHMEAFTEVRDAEQIMREFCQSLPKDRLLDAPDSDEGELEEGDYYVEPTTGAKLTESSAMNLIAHYVGHLPQEDDEVIQPTYILKPLGKKFTCELQLPTTSPLYHFEGSEASTKMGAKRAVAFEACLKLRFADLLDENLLPRYRVKSKPAMANAHLALDSHKSNSYAYRMKPAFWNVDDDKRPEQLWLTFLIIRKPEDMFGAAAFSQIGFFTRHKLPKMPSFPVYADKGGRSFVDIISLNKPWEPTKEQMDNLNEMTLRIFSDIFNKVFLFDYSTMFYWFAPLKQTGVWDPDTNPEDAIDMECLSMFVEELIELPWEDPEELIDRFLVDRITRSRRFCTIRFEPFKYPDDPIPEDTTFVQHLDELESIKDYSYNQGRRGEKYKFARWTIPEDEPVFFATRVHHRLDYLEPPNKRDMTSTVNAYIVPSPFFVSVIPMSMVRAIMIFPAISTRIDAYLHAWEVCGIVGMQVDLALALEAITKDADNTNEHSKEQQNKQRGMGNNYERLEFLGDCYLKLGTSISLFVSYAGEDEFAMHVRRMVLVCNQNLFDKACRMGIPAYIQTHGFSRRFWYPAMKQLHGKGVGKEQVKESIQKHRLGDKSIADVCEALIGAALLDQELDGAARMVTCILSDPDHSQTSFRQYYEDYEKPAWSTAPPTASQLKLAQDIADQFGYMFRSPRVLISAFNHPSNPFSYEKVPCYQRLEFLGDALLDLACVRYIFDRHPDADPQWLTEHKMAMVSNKFLGAVCVELGFHKKLRKVGTQLDVAIRDYAAEIEEARAADPSPNFWIKVSAPPKALPDILEAFIGALFVDDEFNYDRVLWFFYNYIQPYFVDMTLYDDFAGQHPTTFLTKELTNRGCENWGYESEQFRGKEEAYMVTAVMIHNRVFAYGKGVSVKNARVEASEKALKKLARMRESKFYDLCDCIRTKKVVEGVDGVAVAGVHGVEGGVTGVEETQQEKMKEIIG